MDEPGTGLRERLRQLTALYLQQIKQEIPDNCLFLDIETTGLCSKEDLVIQIAFAKGLGPIQEYVLDWTCHPAVNRHWLEQRLASTRQQIAQRHPDCPFPFDCLRLAQGIAPEEGLRLWKGQWDVQPRPVLVTYNGHFFDVPFLEQMALRFLNERWDMHHCPFVDVGLLMKAAQLNWQWCAGDTPARFATRVYHCPNSRALPWSLNACLKAWDLGREVPALRTSHEADKDVAVLRQLFLRIIQKPRGEVLA
jgi:hypothetical protein